jgi:superfamily I DNA/RNA helicase
MAYNKLQQEAIDCTDEKILVTACPGSGKTHTMVGAIAKYKQENPKDRVVAITFTRKAAAELNLKLYEYPDVESATIHSWSLKELKKLGGKYNFEVSLLQDEQVTEILKMICRRLGYWSMNYFMLFAYVMGNYNIDVSQGTKMKYEKILRNYIVYKRENQLYDFTDLPLYLYDMLNLYNERITNIDALYVDEFQDVDKTQAKIFEMVDTKRKFYVGDAWQSIYIFRGADESVLEDLEGFTHLTLNTNYRSYQSILDFATAAREHECVEAMMGIPEESWIKAARTQEKGQVYLIDSNEECWNFSGGVGEAVYSNSMSVMRNFMQYKPYILCRSNKQVKEIKALGYNNVSTVHQAKGLEYPYVVVTHFDTPCLEEVNIMYVACTRAQNGLVVTDYKFLHEFLKEGEVNFKDTMLFGEDD